MKGPSKSQKGKQRNRGRKRPLRFPLPLSPDISSTAQKAQSHEDQVKRIPNPWPPNDIVALLTLVCGTGGSFTFAVYKIIKSWLEYKAAQSIKIRSGDVEIEIKGGMSANMIEKRVNYFKELVKDLDDEKIKIILPPGVKKDIPPQLTNKTRIE